MPTNFEGISSGWGFSSASPGSQSTSRTWRSSVATAERGGLESPVSMLTVFEVASPEGARKRRVRRLFERGCRTPDRPPLPARDIHSRAGYIRRLGRPFVGREPLSPRPQISVAGRGDFRVDACGESDSEAEGRVRERETDKRLVREEPPPAPGALGTPDRAEGRRRVHRGPDRQRPPRAEPRKPPVRARRAGPAGPAAAPVIRPDTGINV